MFEVVTPISVATWVGLYTWMKFQGGVFKFEGGALYWEGRGGALYL